MTTPNTPAPALQAESDLTYTPPPGPEQAEIDDFDQALKDIVGEIEGEYDDKPQFTDEELDADEAGTKTSEAQPVEPETKAEDPAIERGMERLVSREVALQAKEQAFQAREARVAALEQEVTQLRSSMPAKDVQERLAYSPTEAIKALGHDPETVVRLMIAEQLEAKGQPVPPELKEFVKDAANTRKFKALEDELAASRRAQESATFFNAVALGAREYVKDVSGNSKNLPTLAEIAKANPERAHREIMEEILNDARQRMAADPNGEPMTYEQAARKVEARMAEYKTLLGSQGPAPTNPAKQAQSGKPLTPPQQKPPVRPLKPWEKKDQDIFAQGLQEAEREFHRQEALAKRRQG